MLIQRVRFEPKDSSLSEGYRQAKLEKMIAVEEIKKMSRDHAANGNKVSVSICWPQPGRNDTFSI